MMRRRFKYFFVFILFSFGILQSQDDYVVNTSKFLQKINPSYFGFNSLMNVGVLYNSMNINAYDKMDNKYVFGSLSFENLDFSIGMDINTFKIQNTGYTSNLINLSYIYKLQLDNNLFLLPAVTIGFGSKGVNPSNLILEDQIIGLGIPFGTIAQQTNDELVLAMVNRKNYFDLGASFLIHNEKYLAGLSFKRLNRPNISYDGEDDEKNTLPMQISLQGGYEFDLNPYERRFLPRYSYLYTFISYTKQGQSSVIFLSQDIQLGEFSFGLNQHLGSGLNGTGLNNFGVSLGLAVENFDFGLLYNFPVRKPATSLNEPASYSPSIFELFITFDFSIYRRNRRGQFNRLSTDNYY